MVVVLVLASTVAVVPQYRTPVAMYCSASSTSSIYVLEVGADIVTVNGSSRTSNKQRVQERAVMIVVL